MVLEARYIHHTKDEALLSQAMEEVFYPTWPEYDPHNPANKTTESIKGLMDLVENPPEGHKPFIMVVGENLDNPEKRNIIGFKYAFYLPHAQSAMPTYLAVKEESRNEGIGHAMADFTQQGLKAMAAADGKKLKAIVFEIHDPRKVSKTEDHAMDPTVRKAIFENWGAREVGAEYGVNLQYMQPCWEPGGPQEDTFMLMAYPIDGEYPQPDALLGFIRDFYSKYAGMSDEDMDNNQGFIIMTQQINLMKARALQISQDPHSLDI